MGFTEKHPPPSLSRTKPHYRHWGNATNAHQCKRFNDDGGDTEHLVAVVVPCAIPSCLSCPLLTEVLFVGAAVEADIHQVLSWLAQT